MTDWNALWDTHFSYLTEYTTLCSNINNLAQELPATLIKAAEHPAAIAVYQQDENLILIGKRDNLPLQGLTLNRHSLFVVSIRLVPDATGRQQPARGIEVRVRNEATEEQATWQAPLHFDAAERPWLGKQLLEEGVMPEMAFDQLSFTDNARFRDLLYSCWQQRLPELTAEITAHQHAGHDSNRQQMRYQALIQHEQAWLARRFSQDEWHWLSGVLAKQRLTTPTDCRGLWLRLEAQAGLAPQTLDIDTLLDKMRSLSYAQELAMIEKVESGQ
jgi:hypothetical protein